jgi:mannose-6-phosphate isomerase-like protein (cupin superfamily)
VTEAEPRGVSSAIALAQSVLQCAPGGALARATEADEEVLFVVSGAGVLQLGDDSHRFGTESGAYLAPGEEYVVMCSPGSQPLRIVSVRIPGPPADNAIACGPRAVVRRLDEQTAQEATGEREFRIVADPGSGLRSATHFVGYIPPGRAPDHFHTYDEVIYILEGHGAFHAGGGSLPVTVGSCLELPACTVHSLENSSGDMMRVVAVFRPAGSPAAAYYPDGTPAHADAPPLAEPLATGVPTGGGIVG